MRRVLCKTTTLAAVGAALCASPASAASPARPWADARLSPERRSELLLAAMTPEEKLGLVHGRFPLLMSPRPPGVQVSAGWFPGVPRLGVPPITETDASLGVSNARRGPTDDATALPSGLSLASSFDPDVAFAGGAMIGKEARQKGFNVLLAGGANLVRDPRNGRNFEYLGEDPLLTGVMAGASIRGVQSNGIVSTTKHLVLNAQETGRQVLDAQIDPAALRESDLLAFQIAVEQGRPGAIMCSYNRLGGAYACENQELLSIPKRDWGWRGWIMSDWGAVHSVRAANAGLDQESGQELDKQVFFDAPLKAELASGAVTQARLDDMVRRVLWGLFSTGAMDRPVQAGGLDTKGDGAVAQRAAEAGIVLLKNEGGVLPLVGAAQSLAVIGGHADVGVLSGGGSSQVLPIGSTSFPAPKGSPEWGGGQVYHPSPPLAALRARNGRVTFDPGTDPAVAAASAHAADVAVVFAPQWTTEGQDVPLSLPDGQDALIAAVAAANPRTVVVLETGGPVLMPWLDKVAAVVEAWYPGSRGGEAIARVLSGEVDAQGRLPVSFPNSAAQLPRPVLDGYADAKPEGLTGQTMAPFPVRYAEGSDVGYRWYARTGARPLFGFGGGLSYTRFRYAGLQAKGDGALRVSLQVTNTGSRPGVAAPQVYVRPPGLTPRLVGWARAELRPGETRRVQVDCMATVGQVAHAWRRPAGRYLVTAGASSADAPLAQTVTLSASEVRDR